MMLGMMAIDFLQTIEQHKWQCVQNSTMSDRNLGIFCRYKSGYFALLICAVGRHLKVFRHFLYFGTAIIDYCTVAYR